MRRGEDVILAPLDDHFNSSYHAVVRSTWPCEFVYMVDFSQASAVDDVRIDAGLRAINAVLADSYVIERDQINLYLENFCLLFPPPPAPLSVREVVAASTGVPRTYAVTFRYTEAQFVVFPKAHRQGVAVYVLGYARVP